MKNPPAYPCTMLNKEVFDTLKITGQLSMQQEKALASYHPGMTLFDYYVGQALAGLSADYTCPLDKTEIANYCCDLAFEIMKARGLYI